RLIFALVSFLRLLLRPFDHLAPHVAAVVAAVPSGGVMVAVDDNAGRVGANAGDAHLIDRDDRRLACPLHLDGHRHGDIDLAESDTGFEGPLVSFDLSDLT